MTNDLVKTGPGVSPADIFFDRPMMRSNWGCTRIDIAAGRITTEYTLAKIKAMEPLAEEDYRDFEHWRLQQILRLCLYNDARKPMEGKDVCETCGKHNVDPLSGKECLYCLEEYEQTYNGGYRGNCEFVLPKYNHMSRSWGILYYWSHSDNTFILWLADYYKTRQDAQAAIQPVKHYIDWLNVKYKGMLVHWMHFSSLIAIDEVMKMKLPLTPEQFRDLLRSKIEADMAQEQHVMGYYVKDALDNHARAERDE